MMPSEKEVFKCHVCGGEIGEFSNDTGNHTYCDRLEATLQEMEQAYSKSIEIDAVHQAFPGFVERLSCENGRHLANVIRRKMKETDE